MRKERECGTESWGERRGELWRRWMREREDGRCLIEGKGRQLSLDLQFV